MTVKIAFLGCAHIHTPAFVEKVRKRADFQPVAVWDHDAARAAANAELLNAAAVQDPEKILLDPAIQAVVICSETDRHFDLVLRAAAAGKHMFVEKPLGFDAGQAQKMADAVEKAGVIFQTGYFMRGKPEHLFLKRHIASGSFGRITRVRHSNCHSGSLGGWFDTQWRWMADPAIAGCGAFGDLGTHSLDIILWLLGKPVRAAASIHTLTGRYGAACDEYGEGMLLYPDNTIATIAAGWVDCANPAVFEICGTEGHAVFVNGQLYFKSSRVEGADGLAPWTGLPELQPHAFDLFLEKLTGQDVPLVSVREAALRNEVMDALYRANREKRFVEI